MLLRSPMQVAYVTRDVGRACATLGQKYGVRQFLRQEAVTLETEGGRSMTLSLAHAWIGPTWLEVIEPVDGEVAIYRDWLPRGVDIRLHHLGVKLADDREAAQFLDEAAEAGHSLALKIVNPKMKAYYLDTAAELGHYLEYLLLHPGETMMSSMPQNDARTVIGVAG